jgi:hypothetical protein
VFDRKAFLVKERVGFLKLSDTYDIFDPATGAQIGIAREQVGPLLHVLRFLISKRLLPTVVEVREREGGPVLLSIRRSPMSHVTVRNQAGQELGRFKTNCSRSARGSACSTPPSGRWPRSRATGKGGTFAS